MYYEKALSEMQDKYDENTSLSFARFYDIAFVYEGVEIEPSGNVSVRIEYKEAVEIEESTSVDTIHFDKKNDEKPEVINSDTEGTKKEVEAVEFKSDQFSVYGVVGGGVVVEKVFDGSVEGSYKMDTDENIVKAGTVVDPDSVSEEDFKVESSNEDDALDASFDTGVFSTFTVTWTYSYRRNVTVHYGYMNGNTFVEFPNGTPSNVNIDYNSSKDRYSFLIYDVEGYQYKQAYYRTTTSTNPTSGSTSITPLLYYDRDGDWKYYGQGNNSYLANNSHIYMVYEPKTATTTGGTPQVDTDETWPDQEDPARKPQFTKSSTNNGNGTNNISLTITGPEKPVEKSTPADVIVVFDVSGSMGTDDMSGTRLAAAKTAVNTMANTLLNGDNSDVRMALISFSTTAQTVPATGEVFTDSYSTFYQRVNGLSASGGTNWEQALQLANTMQVREDAATFVVFVTDGDPTFRVSRGNVSDGNLDLYSDGTYQYYRNNHVFGEGNDDSDGRNFDFAVDQV